MKEEKLFEAMADINEDYVADAHKVTNRKRKSMWMKWVAVAACLCVVVIGAVAIPKTKAPVQTPDGVISATTTLYNDSKYIESQPSTAPEQSDISEIIPGAGTIVFSTELETALESKIENIEVILYFRDFSDDEYREKHLESLMYEGKTISDWKNIWQNSLEEKDEKKYVEAYEFAANSDEFIDWLKNYEIEFQNKAIAEELERLKAVGYNFQTQKDASGFTGILSKQQIIDFPCVDYVGYYLDAN